MDDSGNLFNSTPLDVNITTSTAETPEREQSVSPAIFEFSKKMDAARLAWNHAWDSETIAASVASNVENIENRTSAEVPVSTLESRENPEVSKSTAEVSKANESQTTFVKKPAMGEQQNVCKVKPQQQQPAKPQQSATMIAHVPEENNQPKLESVQLQQNMLSQDQFLQQPALAQYPFHVDHQLVRLQQRQPQHAFIQQQRQPQTFLQQQSLQQMQQSTQQPNYQIVQQIRQPQSTPSPLSQTGTDVYPSFLPGSLYSPNTFQAQQSVVPVPILASTTTQTFGSTTKTQSSALNFQSQQQLPTQQAKPATASLYTPNMTPSPTQAVYLPFDAPALGGGPALFGLNQSQAAQRQIMTNFGDATVFSQQGNLQVTQQPVQRTFPYPQRRPFESSQATQMPKAVDQPGRELTQSELAKHINAKPFEPPKRLSTPTSSVTPPSSSPGMTSMITSSGMINQNIMPVQPSPPTMGTLSQSPPVSTTYVTSRNMSISPVAPTTNMSIAQGMGSFQKQSPIGQFQLQHQQPQQYTPFQQHQVHIQPTLQHQQMRAQVPPQQTHQSSYPSRGPTSSVPTMTNQMMPSMAKQFVRNPGPVGTMQQAQPVGQRFQGPRMPRSQSVGQRFPGPIQRPPVSVAMQGMMQAHPRPNQPARPQRQHAPTRASVPKSTAAVPVMMPTMPPNQAAQQVFRSQQHQKMLEQTKQFFAQQSHGGGSANPQQRSLQLAPGAEQLGAKPVQRTAQSSNRPSNKTEIKQQVTSLNPDKKPEEAKVGKTDPISKNKKSTDTSNKVSTTVKPEPTKTEPNGSQEKSGSKLDGKGPQGKRGNAGRPQSLPPRFPSGTNRGRPTRGRPTRNGSGTLPSGKQPTNKPSEATQPRVEQETTATKESTQDTSPQKTRQANTKNALASAS